MNAFFDESYLLYRIISNKRFVEFVYVTDKIDAFETINENDIWHITFDELLSELTAFRQSFPLLESVLHRVMDNAGKGKELKKALKELDALGNTSNHLLLYYSQKLKRVLIAEKAYMVLLEMICSSALSSK